MFFNGNFTGTRNIVVFDVHVKIGMVGVEIDGVLVAFVRVEIVISWAKSMGVNILKVSRKVLVVLSQKYMDVVNIF